MKIFDSGSALEHYRQNKQSSTWASAAEGEASYGTVRPGQGAARVFTDFCQVDIRPKFYISSSSAFFAAGSCFARNVERALHEQGRTVLSWRPGLRISNEWFHRYNTFSIISDFDNALRGSLDERLLTEVKPDKFIDFSGYGKAPTREELRAKRQAVIDQHRNMLQADVLILTLGLVEAWFDTQTGRYLNISPVEAALKDPQRYQLHITDYGQNREALEIFLDFITTVVKRDVKVIVTVSPVPLNVTFSEQDVLIANTYSKSVLRAVAQSFADDHDCVDYFPSYEIVTLSRPDSAWLPDYRHVRPEFVDLIMAYFMKHYVA